ncbi:uncharacterized protein LOC124131974 [Haliotis rufescens]|uniref:uncharacterized protein LOC124131974 n=1 Tax=Haliotis rufescens TaxID=6454 RepID=UPI00201E9FF5|nr:uncharacterized protein LOC124131974 [Haliotis rufescens]
MNSLPIIFLVSVCCALGYSRSMNTLWSANPNQMGIPFNQGQPRGQGQVNQYAPSLPGQGQIQGQVPNQPPMPQYGGFPGFLNNPQALAQFQQFLSYMMMRNRRLVPGQSFTNDPRFPGGRGIVTRGDGSDGTVVSPDGTVTSVDGSDISREGGIYGR